MDVRTWWDNAKECGQVAVLAELRLDRSLTGIPWAFLPEEVQCILVRRVRVNEQLLDPEWRRDKN